MSSKLNVKQGKKDRPKSSERQKGKRRDGTPDKSATPSQEAQDENRPPSRHIIWDEEMEHLQIKPEDLEKMLEATPPQESQPMATSTLTVRKMKSAAELNKPKTKRVKVARPATPDADLKPVDISGYAGPRYDAAGRVIHYSILGTFDDYREEATKRGDLLDIPTPRIDEAYRKDKLTVKYEKKRKRPQPEEDVKRLDESNALRNWQQKMIERKRQQGYISKLLQKAPEDLAMNQADSYRKTQEDRYLIDRTIPFVDYGKGYRVGSEFWKQQEQFGDELSGVHMTLTQSERGYPAPVEYVGVPKQVRDEKGIQWDPEYRTPSHHPWHNASYLQQRRRQLEPIMDELSSHKPDFAGLQVIGTNKPHFRQMEEEEEDEKSEEGMAAEDAEADGQKEPAEEDPFRDYPDTRGAPIFGPSLQFAGHSARWTGDSNSQRGQVGIEARVTFEARTGTRVTSHLELVNDGTTSVFFDWKNLPRENPFDLVQPQVQRFYFNNSSGVILPGETLHLPFVFKSGCGGVFTEQWMLETRPQLCGGAALVLTLRGVALEEDRFQPQREALERELQTKQYQQMVVQLLQDLVSGVRTPRRCASPVDAYITEEEIFRRNNAGLSYRHEAVSELKQIHQQLVPEEEKDSAVWDLCILDLKEMIMELDEDDERKEPLLTQLNSLTSSLTFDTQRPVSHTLHNLCHKLLSEAVDTMVSQSSIIRTTMGMSAREMGDLMDDSLNMEKRELRGGQKRSRTATTSESGDSRKGGRPADKGKGDGAKDKKPAAAGAAAAAKDAKASKPGKETPKPDPKAKAPTPSVAKKAAPTPTRPPGGGGVPEPRTSTPTSPPHSPVSQEQGETMERKYREKLYTQMYSILGKKMDEMDRIFQDVLKSS